MHAWPNSPEYNTNEVYPPSYFQRPQSQPQAPQPARGTIIARSPTAESAESSPKAANASQHSQGRSPLASNAVARKPIIISQPRIVSCQASIVSDFSSTPYQATVPPTTRRGSNVPSTTPPAPYISPASSQSSFGTGMNNALGDCDGQSSWTALIGRDLRPLENPWTAKQNSSSASLGYDLEQALAWSRGSTGGPTKASNSDARGEARRGASARRIKRKPVPWSSTAEPAMTAVPNRPVSPTISAKESSESKDVKIRRIKRKPVPSSAIAMPANKVTTEHSVSPTASKQLDTFMATRGQEPLRPWASREKAISTTGLHPVPTDPTKTTKPKITMEQPELPQYTKAQLFAVNGESNRKPTTSRKPGVDLCFSVTTEENGDSCVKQAWSAASPQPTIHSATHDKPLPSLPSGKAKNKQVSSRPSRSQRFIEGELVEMMVLTGLVRR